MNSKLELDKVDKVGGGQRGNSAPVNFLMRLNKLRLYYMITGLELTRFRWHLIWHQHIIWHRNRWIISNPGKNCLCESTKNFAGISSSSSSSLSSSSSSSSISSLPFLSSTSDSILFLFFFYSLPILIWEMERNAQVGRRPLASGELAAATARWPPADLKSDANPSEDLKVTPKHFQPWPSYIKNFMTRHSTPGIGSAYL